MGPLHNSQHCWGMERLSSPNHQAVPQLFHVLQRQILGNKVKAASQHLRIQLNQEPVSMKEMKAKALPPATTRQWSFAESSDLLEFAKIYMATSHQSSQEATSARDLRAALKLSISWANRDMSALVISNHGRKLVYPLLLRFKNPLLYSLSC